VHHSRASVRAARRRDSCPIIDGHHGHHGHPYESAAQEGEVPGTLHKRLFDATLLTWLTSVPPDRVGVSRLLSLGDTLKPTAIRAPEKVCGARCAGWFWGPSVWASVLKVLLWASLFTKACACAWVCVCGGVLGAGAFQTQSWFLLQSWGERFGAACARAFSCHGLWVSLGPGYTVARLARGARSTRFLVPACLLRLAPRPPVPSPGRNYVPPNPISR